MITNTVLDYIYDLHRHRITHWNNAVMSPSQLQVYADAISECGAPLENCFGFIDGTVSVQYVALGKTREWFIMARKGYMP